jgi:hypothetical protein
MRHYAFTTVACAIVGVVAMAMTGAASQSENPPPIKLSVSASEPVAASAQARRVGDHRANRPARDYRRAQRRANIQNAAGGVDDSTAERGANHDAGAVRGDDGVAPND